MIYIARIPSRFLMEEPSLMSYDYEDSPEMRVKALVDAHRLEIQKENVSLRIDDTLHLLSRRVVIQADSKEEALKKAREIRATMIESRSAFTTHATCDC